MLATIKPTHHPLLTAQVGEDVPRMLGTKTATVKDAQMVFGRGRSDCLFEVGRVLQVLL